MNLANWLLRQAIEAPDRPALFLGADCIADYGGFWDDACALAGWLKTQGVQPGDRVAIFMANAPEFLIAFYGIWIAGAAVVPINAKLHGREAGFILNDCDAKHVFADNARQEALEAAEVKTPVTVLPGMAMDKIRLHDKASGVVHRAPDDLAWLFYTSGTTGKPKGVIITHRMLSLMSMCYEADVDQVQADDVTLYAAPMSHGAGIYNMIHVRRGAGHVCPVSGGFEPAEIFELSRHFGNTHLFAAPTMVQRLTQVGKTLNDRGDGLRTVIYAGGPMYNADIIEAVDHFGSKFAQVYGQGECPMGISTLSRDDVADRDHSNWQARLQSVGRAQSAVEVAIGDQDGNLLPVGSHGEIMVRGDTVMPGYWQNPEATAKTILNGWLMTGDMGFLDADGYITMQDRSKDMIISGGSNVYPREVEEVLLLDQDVREVSVVGRPHPEWGEEVVAFVVGNIDEARLDRLCLDNIARFKRPKAYFQISALPKNNYGKILKTELRKML